MLTALALSLALGFAAGPAVDAPMPSGGVATQTGLRSAPAPGADSALDARTREVAASLRCPVCQGQSLQDSDAPLAGEMRDLIREKLHAGESPANVRAYFVSKYGQWILLRPDPQGFVLMVYVLPIVGVLAGAVFIFLAARRWLRAAAVEADGPTPSATSERF
jgi:cytochrome c-type biogenesis protein CcmH